VKILFRTAFYLSILGFCAFLLLPFATDNEVRVSVANSYARLSLKLQNPKFVFVGDSITRGGGLWAARLHEAPWRVLNLARSGLTSQQLVPLVDQAISMKPEYIIYMSGTNDVEPTNSQTPEQVVEAFRHLVEASRRNNINLIVTMAPPTANAGRNAQMNQLNQAIKDILRQSYVHVIDLWPDFLAGDVIRPELTSDGIHLTEAAYELWENELTIKLLE
jgi:lysophospholipase L1-like esterase